MYLNLQNWEPFEFWPYTTVVLDRILQHEAPWRPEDAAARHEIREIEHNLIEKFNDFGIKTGLDNKIAFGLRHITSGQVLYIGFYDGAMIIGATVRSDGWNKPSRKA